MRLAIAAAYAAAPLLDERAVPSWRALAHDSVRLASRLLKQYTIHVTEDQPYELANAMLADIARGKLVVSVANSDHPLWTRQENLAFRIVHDIMGHGHSLGDFSWEGEVKACASHRSCVTLASLPALFTECLGQVAYQTANGAFGPQKVAILNV